MNRRPPSTAHRKERQCVREERQCFGTRKPVFPCGAGAIRQERQCYDTRKPAPFLAVLLRLDKKGTTFARESPPSLAVSPPRTSVRLLHVMAPAPSRVGQHVATDIGTERRATTRRKGRTDRPHVAADRWTQRRKVCPSRVVSVRCYRKQLLRPGRDGCAMHRKEGRAFLLRNSAFRGVDGDTARTRQWRNKDKAVAQQGQGSDAARRRQWHAAS